MGTACAWPRTRCTASLWRSTTSSSTLSAATLRRGGTAPGQCLPCRSTFSWCASRLLSRWALPVSHPTGTLEVSPSGGSGGAQVLSEYMVRNRGIIPGSYHGEPVGSCNPAAVVLMGSHLRSARTGCPDPAASAPVWLQT